MATLILGLGLLLVEVTVLSLLAVALHALKERLGLAPLLLYAGGLLVALNVFTPAALSWELAPGFVVPTVSITLFPVLLCLIALVYTLEGTGFARAFLIGLLCVQVIFTLISYAFAFQAAAPWSVGPAFPEAIAPPAPSPRIYFGGYAALAIDLVCLVTLYQGLLNRFPRAPVPVVLGLSLGAIMVLDSVVYLTLARLGTEFFWNALLPHLTLKPIAGVVVGALLGAYLEHTLHRYPAEIRSELLRRPMLTLLRDPDALLRVRRELAETRLILQEMQDRFKGILEDVPGWIYVVNPRGEVLFANDSLATAVGSPAEDLMGARADQVLARVSPHLARLALEPGTHTCETPAPPPPGTAPNGTATPTLRHLTLKVREIRPSAASHGACFVGIVEDTTEQRLLEDLQAANARQRAGLSRMAELNRELEDFTYTVTHDLSEPLRGIETLSNYLREDLRERTTPEEREMLERMHVSAKRLRETLSALLTLSRLTRSEAPPERVDVDALVHKAAETLAPTQGATPENVHVVGEMPQVEAPAARVESIFMNLLSNALKYAGGDRAKVEVRATDRGDAWEFSVADNGPGIPLAERDRVFRLFRRGPGTSGIPGSGAGLAIVSRLVRGEGGDIWIEDSPLGGAEFHFTLPKRGGPGMGGAPA